MHLNGAQSVSQSRSVTHPLTHTFAHQWVTAAMKSLRQAHWEQFSVHFMEDHVTFFLGMKNKGEKTLD